MKRPKCPKCGFSSWSLESGKCSQCDYVKGEPTGLEKEALEVIFSYFDFINDERLIKIGEKLFKFETEAGLNLEYIWYKLPELLKVEGKLSLGEKVGIFYNYLSLKAQHKIASGLGDKGKERMWDRNIRELVNFVKNGGELI